MNQLYACAIGGDTFFFQADIKNNQIPLIEEVIASFPASSIMDNQELFFTMLKKINADTDVQASPLAIQYVFRNHR